MAGLRVKLHSMWPLLDERTRRLMAASEAQALGYGGVSLVQRACGLSRKAIAKGLREIAERSTPGAGRIRRPGGGRKPLTVSDPRLVAALEAMIEDQTRGDPESPLRWICKSTRAIAHELKRQKLRSATPRSPSCCTGSTTASRATGRPRRDAATRTATRNFATSTPS